METENVTYDSLNVGDKFIHDNWLKQKMKPVPPVIPVAFSSLREATIGDTELYPIIEEL